MTKKYNLRNQADLKEVHSILINKQLEPYGITYDKLIENKDNQFIEGKEWFQYYTFKNEQEYNRWQDFCLDFLTKNTNMSKKEAEKEFSWFSLQWGLKIEEYNNAM